MEKYEQLHQNATVIDIHDHMCLPEDMADMEQGCVTAKFCHLTVDINIFDEPGTIDDDPMARFLKALDNILSLIETSGGHIVIARCAADVEAAKKEGRQALFLGNEGGAFLRGSVEALRVFYRLGLRFLQLTWGASNDLAAAQIQYFDDIGLTPAGKSIIAEMCKLGMIIDISHLSRRSIEDCFDLSTKPLIFSHGHAFNEVDCSGLDKLFMRRLAENRGVIGMHFCSHLINPAYFGVYDQAPISDLLDRIDLATELGGEDCVALGCDYMHMTPYFLGSTQQPWLSHVKGIENIRYLPRLTQAMTDRGYSDEFIMKVLGGNAMRLIKETIG